MTMYMRKQSIQVSLENALLHNVMFSDELYNEVLTDFLEQMKESRHGDADDAIICLALRKIKRPWCLWKSTTTFCATKPRAPASRKSQLTYSCPRQMNAESCTCSRIRTGSNAPAMCVCDFAGDEQTKA